MDYSFYYSTKRLFVLFDLTNNKVKCTIYNKQGKSWQVVQSYTMKRPGLSNLDKKTESSVCRQMLKAMRKRMSQSLYVILNQK